MAASEKSNRKRLLPVMACWSPTTESHSQPSRTDHWAGAYSLEYNASFQVEVESSTFMRQRHW